MYVLLFKLEQNADAKFICNRKGACLLTSSSTFSSNTHLIQSVNSDSRSDRVRVFQAL